MRKAINCDVRANTPTIIPMNSPRQACQNLKSFSSDIQAVVALPGFSRALAKEEKDSGSISPGTTTIGRWSVGVVAPLLREISGAAGNAAGIGGGAEARPPAEVRTGLACACKLETGLFKK